MLSHVPKNRHDVTSSCHVAIEKSGNQPREQAGGTRRYWRIRHWKCCESGEGQGPCPPTFHSSMQTLLTSLRTTSRAAHSARYVIGGALVLGSSTLLWNNTYLDERPHAKARGGIHPDAPLIPRQSTVLLRNGSGIQRYDISQAPR